MTEAAKESRFWSIFGKISLVVIFFGGVATLIDWFIAPTAEVQAEIEKGTFYLPPRYEEFSKSVEEALSPESMETTLQRALGSFKPDSTPAIDEGFERLTFVMSRDLSEQVMTPERLTERPYRQYWHAKVRNTGDLPVTQAALRLPGATVAVISREDLTETQDDTGPTIEIGNIAAGETVEVTAWNDSFLLSLPDSQSPSLYHAGGSGSVKITNEPSLMTVLLMNKVLTVIISIFAALAAFFIGQLLALKRDRSKNEET